MQKTKITLFGATGKTGAQLIDQALRRDYELTLFVRSGTSFDDARVRIVRGDLLDPAALAMRPSYNDMIGLAEEIRASSLDWTMVRSAVLNDKETSPRLNVGLYGHTSHSLTLPRASLAQFMLDQVTSSEFVRQAPGLSART